MSKKQIITKRIKKFEKFLVDNFGGEGLEYDPSFELKLTVKKIKEIRKYGVHRNGWINISTILMKATQCHKNSILLTIFIPELRFCHGVALRNGYWHQHSWVKDGDIILETLFSRDEYFGVEYDNGKLPKWAKDWRRELELEMKIPPHAKEYRKLEDRCKESFEHYRDYVKRLKENR